MNKMSTKRKIQVVLISIVSLFLIYLGLNIYQAKKMEIISFEEINNLQVSTNNELKSDTKITGTVELDNSEAVALMDQMVVNETLYIIIYKWPSFKQDNSIDFDLGNAENLNQVERISLVYGDIYSGEGNSRGISFGDLTTHPDQTVIWEKKGAPRDD